MAFSDKFVEAARKVLPSPFTIAVLLTLLTMALAIFIQPEGQTVSIPSRVLDVFGFWEKGFWDFLTFSMQMVLILVLGHALAVSKPVEYIIKQFVRYCDNTAKAALLVSLLTMLFAFINWGLCLIFGALFARKVAEYAQVNSIKLNYPLIGAAGFSGMMVWHGGLSGSAPLVVAGADHSLVEQIGQITASETVFSPANILIWAILLVLIPAALYWLGKRVSPTAIKLKSRFKENKNEELSGAERLDHSPILCIGFGLLVIAVAIYAAKQAGGGVLGFLQLNWINFALFGFGLVLHGKFASYLRAIDQAVRGASGIIIQFPLYAGIMGIMKYGGLIYVFSKGLGEMSTATTFPIFTFMSAALVNVFVPSGGGQWIVQGPIIVDAAQSLGYPVQKAIMALAYGDQLTNMMQPFWALPLLGITGLKAKDILPYTLFLMAIGFVVFLLGLLIL